MAIDINAAQLLMRSQRNGVCFHKIATLGRQGLDAPVKHVLELLRAQKWEVAPKEREGLMAPSSKGDAFLRILGAAEIVSVDASDYEGAAVVHDLNFPIPDHLAEQFDVVFDGGTLEHVFNFPVGIANAMRMVRTGGHYIAATPANNFFGHGFYQFSAELYYRVFCQQNGFQVESMVVWEESADSKYYEITDPATVRTRVEFISSQPTYLYIQARKIASVPLFSTYPLQSDYTTVWQIKKEGETANDAAEPVLPKSWPFRIRAAARRHKFAKFAGRLSVARRLHSWAFRIGHLRENVRGYWKPIPGLKVQRFSSRQWLH